MTPVVELDVWSLKFIFLTAHILGKSVGISGLNMSPSHLVFLSVWNFLNKNWYKPYP